ncbi:MULTISPECIES: helix-turn-helix transcriptional regulator [Arsenicicoccus]|uniref:helix-turn-helix transcriptional regulator n=1 Tax=Arsenicicoccus TaxID=267408 RepID=UPI00257AA08F|nr:MULTISPECIES: helix-turn-helix transcriptional regulator [Arsenicicoccus]
MSSPVLATKLFVPARRPRLVPRPRLAARLDGSLEGGHRLTLVSAPAGFGKSSLLADWAAQLARREPPVRVGWMSLGDEDDDLAAFLALLAASLAGLDIQVDGSALGRHRDATAAASAVIDAVVRADALRPGAVRVLVMDDVHLVRAPEVHQAVAFLVDHLPAGLHLVLSTRSDPPLALARLRARGELIELRAADLRFTRAEAEDFLVAAMGLTLDAHDVDALEGRTEGWIAGLQLVSLALGGRSGGGQAHDFVRDFAGSHRFVLDYLTDEVLDRQPAPVREFLLRTAVLDRLCGPACDALTGRTDGTAMLERVWADNLFLVSLDDDRSWYRYHHLFADVLRARLSAQEPDLVADLHRLASRWFAANGYLVEAVGQALAGSDDERAAYLVEDAVPLLRRSRQDSLLLGWIRALPRARVRVSPVLSLVCAWSLMLEGDLEGADARLDDADAVLAAGRADASLAAGWAPTDDLRSAPATVSVYRAALAQARGDLVGAAYHARGALALALPDDHLTRGAATGLLALAAWAAGEMDEALSTYGLALDCLRRAGNVVDVLDGGVVLADLRVAAGHPARARRVCEESLREAPLRGGPHARSVSDLHVALAELDHRRGARPEALDHLEVARELRERASITENRHRWFVVMAQVLAADGDHETALSQLDQAEGLYRRGFYPELRPIPAMRARIRIASGDLSGAQAWADETGVRVTDECSYLASYEQLTVVRLQLARCAPTRRTGRPQTPSLPCWTAASTRFPQAAGPRSWCCGP